MKAEGLKAPFSASNVYVGVLPASSRRIGRSVVGKNGGAIAISSSARHHQIASGGDRRSPLFAGVTSGDAIGA